MEMSVDFFRVAGFFADGDAAGAAGACCCAPAVRTPPAATAAVRVFRNVRRFSMRLLISPGPGYGAPALLPHFHLLDLGTDALQHREELAIRGPERRAVDHQRGADDDQRRAAAGTFDRLLDGQPANRLDRDRDG